MCRMVLKLHEGHHDAAIHYKLDCLFNGLFGIKANKTSKPRGGFPTQRANNTESVSRVTSHPVATAAAWRHAWVFSRRTSISPLVEVRMKHSMLARSQALTTLRKIRLCIGQPASENKVVPIKNRVAPFCRALLLTIKYMTILWPIAK